MATPLLRTKHCLIALSMMMMAWQHPNARAQAGPLSPTEVNLAFGLPAATLPGSVGFGGSNSLFPLNPSGSRLASDVCIAVSCLCFTSASPSTKLQAIGLLGPALRVSARIAKVYTSVKVSAEVGYQMSAGRRAFVFPSWSGELRVQALKAKEGGFAVLIGAGARQLATFPREGIDRSIVPMLSLTGAFR